MSPSDDPPVDRPVGPAAVTGTSGCWSSASRPARSATRSPRSRSPSRCSTSAARPPSSAWSSRPFALAEVVTVLFGGVLGDRVSRKLMMEGSAAACALSQAVLATLLIGDWATIPMLAGDRRGHRLPGRAEQPVVVGDDPAHRAAGPSSPPRSRAPAAPDQRRRGRLRARRGPGRRRRVRLGDRRRRRDVRRRGGVLTPCCGCPHTRPEGVRPSLLGRSRRGLPRGVPAHLAVAADRPGAALPPVLRRRAGRARADRRR